MRTIERTNIFKRDFKREKSGKHKRDLEALVFVTISLLAQDNAHILQLVRLGSHSELFG
jgi:mRNA-degrading endonuclease YafQ of YafQ-DinJ toxin-antitoxin module